MQLEGTRSDYIMRVVSWMGRHRSSCAMCVSQPRMYTSFFSTERWSPHIDGRVFIKMLSLWLDTLFVNMTTNTLLTSHLFVLSCTFWRVSMCDPFRGGQRVNTETYWYKQSGHWFRRYWRLESHVSQTVSVPSIYPIIPSSPWRLRRITPKAHLTWG